MTDDLSWESAGIAVVTFRRRETKQNATLELLEILSELTAVSLITTKLAADSSIQDSYSVDEISQKGTGDSIGSAMLRFVLNQLRTCLSIRRSEAGIILFFGASSYVVPILFGRLIGRTVVIEPRGDVPLTLRLRWEEQAPNIVALLLSQSVWVLERLGFSISHAIITYSPSMAEQLELDGFESKLYTDGARFVPIDRFQPTIPYEVRDRSIGYIGRLDIEKGIDTLIDMVKALPDDISFTFVGDGEFRKTVETDLANEIEQGRVETTGWVDHDDVPDFLNRMRLLVMPSSPTEGLPSTILEAFACGTPVYATPVAGVPDVVHDGETGFLMTDQRPHAIADRIVEILARDDVSQISERCRDLIEEEYSFDATVDRYRRMFDGITDET